MSGYPAPQSTGTPLRHALAAIGSVVAAFLLGNIATFPNLPWYETLAKPPFNPPNWLFGPAWTLLYVLMALAFYRILQQPGGRPGRRAAITAFLVQIVFNAAWSWAFFAAHNPLFGLLVIAALVLSVAWTLVLFSRLDRIAGLCFVPYLAWLLFAAALNASILVLNR